MKVALVTGASTGIGRATAHRLIRDNYFVVLTARQSSLARLADDSVLANSKHHWVRPLDVLNSSEQSELFNEIETRLGRLDVLVNNAAIFMRSTVQDLAMNEAQDLLRVNCLAPLELMQRALPIMQRRRFGRIVNVSSAAGFLAAPTLGGYSASKHALKALSEALFFELGEMDVSVSVIEPGFVGPLAHSALSQVTRVPRRSCYRRVSDRMTEIIRQTASLTPVTPEQIAEQIFRLIEMKSPPFRVPATFDAQLLAFIRRILPLRLHDHLLRRLVHRI